MLDEFSNKVALVTGGTRGIGMAVVRHLLELNASVFTCSRNPSSAMAALEPLRMKHPGRLAWTCADVGKAEDIESIVRRAAETFGGLDILVNNAAGVESGGLETLTDLQWQTEFNSKLMAMVRSARVAIPFMRVRGGGAIINVNAIFAKQPHPDFFASSVIRSSCLSLTKLIAHEYAVDGIRANAVGLGVVATDAWKAWYSPDGGSYESFLERQALAYRVPMRRMASAEEVAESIIFLAGPRSSYINGTQLDVDGGMARYV